MTIFVLATAVGMNYFTGFESTRVQDLLLVLSLLSLSVWTLVLISLLIRMGAKAIISYRTKDGRRK